MLGPHCAHLGHPRAVDLRRPFRRARRVPRARGGDRGRVQPESTPIRLQPQPPPGRRTEREPHPFTAQGSQGFTIGRTFTARLLRSRHLTTVLPAETATPPTGPAKPLLYLDVDGVLNPVCPRPGSGYRVHRLLRSEVLLSEAHGPWLRELAQVYELAWASTWEAWANRCIAPLLGIPALPWVACGGANSGAADGDFAPIMRHAAGRPFAWMDDLIPPRLLRRYADRSDVLLLPVEPGQGLRRHHVDRLLARPPRAARFSSGPPDWRPPEPTPSPRRPG